MGSQIFGIFGIKKILVSRDLKGYSSGQSRFSEIIQYNTIIDLFSAF